MLIYNFWAPWELSVRSGKRGKNLTPVPDQPPVPFSALGGFLHGCRHISLHFHTLHSALKCADALGKVHPKKWTKEEACTNLGSGFANIRQGFGRLVNPEHGLDGAGVQDLVGKVTWWFGHLIPSGRPIRACEGTKWAKQNTGLKAVATLAWV